MLLTFYIAVVFVNRRNNTLIVSKVLRQTIYKKKKWLRFLLADLFRHHFVIQLPQHISFVIKSSAAYNLLVSYVMDRMVYVQNLNPS